MKIGSNVIAPCRVKHGPTPFGGELESCQGVIKSRVFPSRCVLVEFGKGMGGIVQMVHVSELRPIMSGDVAFPNVEGYTDAQYAFIRCVRQFGFEKHPEQAAYERRVASEALDELARIEQTEVIL